MAKKILQVEALHELAKRWDHPEVAQLVESNLALWETLTILRSLNEVLKAQRDGAYAERAATYKALEAYRAAGLI